GLSMTEITGPGSDMPEKVTGAPKPRNWARCIIYRTANVRLIPVRPELSGVMAAADIHFDTGQVYLEARGLPDPASLGPDPVTKQPLACYVGWLANPNTRIYKNLGALQPRAVGGFGLGASCDEDLEYLNLLLVTVQANEGGTQPGPLVILVGAVCAATPIAGSEGPVEEPVEEEVHEDHPETAQQGVQEAAPEDVQTVIPGENQGYQGHQRNQAYPPNQVYQAFPQGWPQQPPASYYPPTAYPPENIYVVQAGDTLVQIARRFGTTTEALATRNFITNPDYIYPGQILFVPWR
ncbi:MAG: LysM peptidoglycan-binding domain-containing protein, partial [Syntrophothermus sp.]